MTPLMKATQSAIKETNIGELIIGEVVEKTISNGGEQNDYAIAVIGEGVEGIKEALFRIHTSESDKAAAVVFDVIPPDDTDPDDVDYAIAFYM